MRLKDYIGLSKHCVYALVCEETKSFAVGYAEDLLNALYVVNRDLETPKYAKLRNDIDKVEIVVLEHDIQNNINKKIACGKYVDDYKERGYIQYYPSNFVHYTVHTDVITYKNLTFLVVYLKDRRSNKKIVGLFKNKDSMDQFMQEYYPNNKFKNIYYADNQYTKRYLKNDVDNWSIE
jgi:hypothetical protein